MADLDFGDSTNNNDVSPATNAIDDPVADFLAREQSVLGEIDDDFNKDATTTAPSAAIQNDLFESNDIKVNGDLNESEKQQTNGEINNLSNGLSDLSMNKSTELPQSMMMNQPIIPAEEPESIKIWRQQHLKNLELKDKEEKEKIEELRQQAKKELDDWYKRYREELEKTKKQNREDNKAAEKEWIAERDNEQPANSGQAWEKISKMCDFNPKTSRNTRDTSRMRSILLQLKQNPPASSSSMSPIISGGQSAS